MFGVSQRRMAAGGGASGGASPPPAATAARAAAQNIFKPNQFAHILQIVRPYVTFNFMGHPRLYVAVAAAAAAVAALVAALRRHPPPRLLAPPLKTFKAQPLRTYLKNSTPHVNFNFGAHPRLYVAKLLFHLAGDKVSIFGALSKFATTRDTRLLAARRHQYITLLRPK